MNGCGGSAGGWGRGIGGREWGEWNDERVRESRERRERGTHSRQERGGVGDWREGVGVRTGIVEYNLLGTEGD